MNGQDDLQFARRPGEIFQRLMLYILMVAVVAYVSWPVSQLAYVAITRAKIYSWIALPCIAFIVFMAFLLIYSGKAVRRAFVDRHLPLVALDKVGVTLYRTQPVTVPWTEITGASLEQRFRGSTFLRLDVRDPAVSELGGSGRVVNLQALADQPENLLAAIQLHLRHTQGCL